MAHYPLDTLSFAITPDGYSAPTPTDVLESLKASMRSVFGADILIDADTQDGQLLGIFAQAMADVNAAAQAAYNAFQPDGAIGVGLSANVKINGLRRQAATNSQSDLTLTGLPGTVITNGKVRDTALGNIWDLPPTVTIPGGGTIIATATCEAAGAINAAPHTISIISNPTAGWATADNPVDAIPGVPQEDDALLRERQSTGAAAPAQSRLDAMLAAVKNVDGVTEAVVYENTTNATDSNGLPAHSVGFVIQGGDAVAIATALMNSKTPGCFMYGSTVQTVTDAVGVTQTMRWTIPSIKDIRCTINLTALLGFTTDVSDKISNLLQKYVNKNPSGQPVYWSRLFKAALLTIDVDGNPVTPADPDGNTYDITLLQIDVSGGGGYSENNIAVPFGQQSRLLPGNVHFTVV